MILVSQVLYVMLMFGYNVRVTSMISEVDFEQDPDNEVYYFAYGSNMLKRKMKTLVENAIMQGPAVLKNYRLDFDTYVQYWNGAVATAAEDPGAEIWGVLWSMKAADARAFSSSHYNSSKFYKEKYLIVQMPNKAEYEAFTHVAKVRPKKLPPWMSLPKERQPSAAYLKVLVTAAMENQLPKYYVKKLIGIPTNEKQAKHASRRSLGEPTNSNSLEDFKYQFQIKWVL